MFAQSSLCVQWHLERSDGGDSLELEQQHRVRLRRRELRLQPADHRQVNDCDGGQEESPCEDVFVYNLQALTTIGLLFSVDSLRALDMAEPEKAQKSFVLESVFIFALVWSVSIVLRKAKLHDFEPTACGSHSKSNG